MRSGSTKFARKKQRRGSRAGSRPWPRSLRQSLRLGLWAGAALLVLGIGWAVVSANLGASGPAGAGPDPGDPVLGDPSAPVTLVEYADFKCPFCALFFQETEPRLRRRFVDAGTVRLVWRDFPNIDAESEAAAVAAQCAADQGKFWPYHDGLYGFIRQNFYGIGVNAEGRPAYEGHYEELARAVGLDLSRFRACLSSGSARASVARDRQSGLSQGVRGTPTFFVNGQRVVGAQPYSVFEQLIEQAMGG